MDDGIQTAVVPLQEEKEDTLFHFDYPVARCKGPDWCLRIFNKDGKEWQWVWPGAHAHCELNQQPYQWIKDNKAAIQRDFLEASIPAGELHMGSEHPEHKWGTTVSSRGLIMLLLSFTRRRKMQSTCKGKALQMIKSLVSMCWEKHGGFLASQGSTSLSYWFKGKLQSVALTWGREGFTQNILQVAVELPSFRGVWNTMASNPWHGYRITSSLDRASFADILVLVAWMWANQSHQCWLHVGQQWLPELLVFLGFAMDTMAQDLSQEGLGPIPVVLHKGVKQKNMDAVNRLLLLFRMRHKRRHRQDIASTHADIAPAGLKMIHHEPFYDSMLYAKVVESAFSGISQLQISFLPTWMSKVSNAFVHVALLVFLLFQLCLLSEAVAIL